MQSLETKSSKPRAKSFETETQTRPETFETETETSNSVSRDASRDSITVHYTRKISEVSNENFSETLWPSGWALCSNLK